MKRYLCLVDGKWVIAEERKLLNGRFLWSTDRIWDLDKNTWLKYKNEFNYFQNPKSLAPELSKQEILQFVLSASY